PSTAGSHSSFVPTMPSPQLDGAVDEVVELVEVVDVVLPPPVVVEVVLLELVEVVLVELLVVVGMVDVGGARVDVVGAMVELVVVMVGGVVDVVVVGHAPTRGTQRRISSSRSFRLSEPTASTEMRFCPYFLPPRWSGTGTLWYSPQLAAAPAESGAVS